MQIVGTILEVLSVYVVVVGKVTAISAQVGYDKQDSRVESSDIVIRNEMLLSFDFVDLDECEKESTNECQNGNCTNIVGDYICKCFTGYRQNGRTCVGMEIVFD